MKSIPAIVIFAGMSIVLANPAVALNSRTWISGTGVDQAGCGPIANPCRTLQYAHDNTSSGGEINFKDSAGYGSLVISKSIAIIANGIMAGVLGPANGTAIALNTDYTNNITLRGLTIEGGGTARYGIVSATGGNLYVDGCTIQGFTLAGVSLPAQANKGLNVAILNSDLSNNATGLDFDATGSAINQALHIANSRFVFNSYGLLLKGNHGTRIVLADTTVKSGSTGVNVYGATSIFSGLTITDHVFSGIAAHSGVTLIGRSNILGNGTGITVDQNVVAYSYQNNQINGNTIDISGNLQTAPLR